MTIDIERISEQAVERLVAAGVVDADRTALVLYELCDLHIVEMAMSRGPRRGHINVRLEGGYGLDFDHGADPLVAQVGAKVDVEFTGSAETVRVLDSNLRSMREQGTSFRLVKMLDLADEQPAVLLVDADDDVYQPSAVTRQAAVGADGTVEVINVAILEQTGPRLEQA